MAAVYDKSAKLFLTIMIFFLPEIKVTRIRRFLIHSKWPVFEWRRILKTFIGAVFDPSVV